MYTKVICISQNKAFIGGNKFSTLRRTRTSAPSKYEYDLPKQNNIFKADPFKENTNASINKAVWALS